MSDLSSEIKNAIEALSQSFDDELFSKKESELEEYWFFVWDENVSIPQNLYEFWDMLSLYENHCRRWEEKHNGSICIVERVRDKYLMPKINEFARHLTLRAIDPPSASSSVAVLDDTAGN